jgi:uncharacterized membrane protein
MKKNTFYLLIGCIALALLALFIYSIETHVIPLWIEPLGFILGFLIVYAARKSVTDLIEDERSAKITEMAVVRTFQVFWVVFCAFSIGAVMDLLYFPQFSHEHLQGRPPELVSLRMMGYLQLGLLCLMIFLYVGFRMYYARKYGDWETDEE